MATVTPNYSWPVPTSTDLVKDGATAIEALGDAIDATVYSLSAGGITMITSQTFTAVASVALANDVFTATYSNYLLLFNITSNSTPQTHTLRMRTAGVDNTTANYNYYNRVSNSSAGTDTNTYARTQTSASIGGVASDAQGFLFNIMSPLLVAPTIITYQNSSSLGNYSDGAAVFNANTTFDALKIIVNTGTITGNYQLYGMSD